MGRHTPLTSLKRNSEINLTPLMDLTFILLITFIITFPLIEQGVPVNLPNGKADKLQPEESCSITIDSNGNIYLDEHPIAFDQLAERLHKIAAVNPATAIMIRADKAIAYGEVIKVVRALHDASLTKLALVTQGE